MADSEPVICRVLKLPPEQHPFFRLKDKLEEILRELDKLNFALRASQGAQSSPGALEILHDTRTEAATQAMGLFRAVYFVNNFARIFTKFLVTISPSASSSGQQRPITTPYLCIKATIVAKECEKAQTEMTQFGQDAASSLERAASLLRAHDDTRSSSQTALSKENAQSATDLLRSVNECASILEDTGKYFRELEKHLNTLSEALEASPPSNEESEMVRSRWAEFHAASGQVFAGIGSIRSELSLDPAIFTEDDFPNHAQATTAGRAETTQAIKDSPSAPAPKRSFFRRIMSCFTTWGHE